MNWFEMFELFLIKISLFYKALIYLKSNSFVKKIGWLILKCFEFFKTKSIKIKILWFFLFQVDIF